MSNDALMKMAARVEQLLMAPFPQEEPYRTNKIQKVANCIGIGVGLLGIGIFIVSLLIAR